jgi:hypothetical protein
VSQKVRLDLPHPRMRATLSDPGFVALKASVLGRVLDAG